MTTVGDKDPTPNTRSATPEKPLSRAEWQLMNLCWRLGNKSTARQIYEASLELKERDYRTVKTMLDRMAAKGYLTVEKLGPLSLFTPAIERRRVIGEAIRDFVDVVLDRALAPLFVHLATEDELELSDEEIAALEDLIEKGKEP
ncbi:MAG: BlaI/MecI/CopY family transcriptional regulator [Acidobacteriota bacterium]